jgi:ferredoxin
MRISVVAERCIDASDCTFVACDVFDLDEDSQMVLLQVDPPEELRRDVLIAPRRCPARVIAVDDDGIEERTPKVLQ